ncbi:MAG: acetylxylan esterase [Verrucomicrobiae bacterium]|nr:acetylxylan esterase [Verrucomicrobiae bacterium]
MKIPAFAIPLFLTAVSIGQGQVAGQTGSDRKVALPKVSIHADQPDSRHEPGTPARFRVEVTLEGAPLDTGSLSYVLSDDGYQPIESESLPLTGQPIFIEGKLERSGFLRCEAQWVANDGQVKKETRSVAAAAYAPEKITPSREAPQDFDAFWSEQKARLAAIPVEASLAQLERSDSKPVPDGVELFDLKVRTDAEWPVSGYFARPKAAKAGSLPAVLWTHGAGVRSASAWKAINGAQNGFLSLDINAHGIENGKPEDYYKLLESEGRLKNYRYQGRENRDGMYFRGMFLRLIRAIDFLTSQSEWDGRVMAVVGHSQGGAQALAAGGLDSRVTFIGAGVPAMCDHMGMMRRRISGWPKLVPLLPDGKPDPTVAEVSRYFDGVNFAARCHATAIVSVGFIDTTCPPTSCYAAFNQLRGQVEIINEPEMGHDAPERIQKAFFEALQRHVEQRKSAAD